MANVWKQRMLEKLGKVESTGESPQINTQSQLLSNMKHNLKRMNARLAADIKANEAVIKEDKALADVTLEFKIRAQENPELAMLSNVLATVGEFEVTLADLRLRLLTTIGNNVSNPLEIVQKEFKIGSEAKATFDKTRVAYDASVTKLAGLKKSKNVKADKLSAAEQEVVQMKQTLDESGRSALEAMTDTNSFAESAYSRVQSEIIERMCQYLDVHRDYFEKATKALDRLTKELNDYRQYTEKRKDDATMVRTRAKSMMMQPQAWYFGVSLAELNGRDNCEIPKLLTKCIGFLETHSLNEEGLFRVAASKARVQIYLDDLDAGKDVDLMEPKADAEVVTDIVKHFLRELPEPLLTYELYEEFLSVNDITDPEAKVDKLAQIMKKLPPINLKVALYLSL